MSTQKHADAGRPISVRLPRDLAVRIDAVADGVPRERWVRRAVLLHLERAEAGHPGNAERSAEAAEKRHEKGWGMVMDPEESSEHATVSKPGPLMTPEELDPYFDAIQERVKPTPEVTKGVKPMVFCTVCDRSSASTKWGCPDHGYAKVKPYKERGL